MKAIVLALCLHLAVVGCLAVDAPGSKTGGDPRVAAEFKQCGGSTNCPKGAGCGDIAWESVKCAPGFVCDRQNPFYWQCTNDPATVAKATGVPLAAPAVPGLPPTTLAVGPVAALPVAAPLAQPANVFLTPQQPAAPAVDAAAAVPDAAAAAAAPVAAAAAPADAAAAAASAAAPAEPAAAPSTPIATDAAVAAAAPAGAAAAAAAAPGAIGGTVAPALAYPTLVPTGTRDASSAAVSACACIDVGFNEQACFEGVTKFCEGVDGKSPKSDMAVCESMSQFFNNQNVTAAKAVAQFLGKTCAVSVPPGPNACACLDGLTTAGCKAATLHTCALGSPICAALAFGSEADTSSQAAWDRFIDQSCADAQPASQVAMVFSGVTEADFQNQYAKGVVAALASVTLQPEVSIQQVVVKTIPAKRAAGSRRLLEAEGPGQLAVKYQIRSSPKEAPLVSKRLADAAANSGAGMYQALSANGVPLRPAFSIADGPVVKPGAGSKSSGGLSPGAAAGVAIGVVAAAAAAAGGGAFAVAKKRKASKDGAAADGKAKEAGAAGAAGAAAGAAAAGAAEAGKPIDQGKGDASKVINVQSTSADAITAAPPAEVVAAADAAAAAPVAAAEAATPAAAAAAAVEAPAAAAAPAAPKKKQMFSLSPSGWSTNH